jgi:hypothetical protein
MPRYIVGGDSDFICSHCACSLERDLGGDEEGVSQGRGSVVVSCEISVGNGGSRRVSGHSIFNPIDCIQVSASEEAEKCSLTRFWVHSTPFTCADHRIY